VRQSLSDLSPSNEEPPPVVEPNHVCTVSPLILVHSTLCSWAPDPKVIMQYRDDFVGNSRSYFSLFCHRRTLAPVVTIIYEGCVPGIQRAHFTCEVTCAKGRHGQQRLEEGESRRCKEADFVVDTRSYDVIVPLTHLREVERWWATCRVLCRAYMYIAPTRKERPI